MGKGDKKTKRGKIIMGSYGKLRPKRQKFKIRSKHVKGETVNSVDK
ncbi:30S ribosomal protein THX [Sinomicrobium sp. M5D2P9]